MSEPGREPWQRMLRDVHQLKKSRGREIVDSLLPQIKAKREAIPKRHPNGWLPVPELEIELPPQHAWVYAECFPYQNVRLLP